MPGGGHSHRAGSLRQSNKRNKRSSASKRSVNRRAGGKVAAKNSGRHGSTAGGGKQSKAKANRLHMARQRRDGKRKNLVDARRNMGRGTVGDGLSGARRQQPVPRLVGIISLSNAEDLVEERVRKFVVDGADDTANTASSYLGGKSLTSAKSSSTAAAAAVTAKFAVHKKDGLLTVLTNSASFRPQYCEEGEEAQAQDASVSAALDLCRVCDLVVFCVDGSGSGGPIPAGMSVGGNSSMGGTTGGSVNKIEYDDLVSERGDRVLAAVKAQGLPTPLVLLVNSEGAGDDVGEGMSLASHSVKTARRHALKRRTELRRYVNRLAAAEFGEGVRVTEVDVPADDEDDAVGEDGSAMEEEEEEDGPTPTSQLLRSKKILPVSNASSTASTLAGSHRDSNPTRSALIRTLCTTSASPPRWVSDVPRPYLLADGGRSYDPASRELRLTGYLRGSGAPWDVESLVHVPNLGTFGVKCVEAVRGEEVPLDSRSGRRGKEKGTKKTTTGGGDVAAVAVMSSDDGEETPKKVESDPMKREPLTMFAAPDALDGEQNLVGFDEEHEHHYDDDDRDHVPSGSAKGEKDGAAFHKGEARPAGWSDYQSAWLDALDGGDDEEDDHGELAFALNQKKGPGDGGASVATAGAGGMDLDMDDANDVTAEERRVLLQQRLKSQREDLEFPDEVEIREDERASDRFARYRSLKSFRRSYWDPKENLPGSYGPLYHFASFRATQGDVMADARDVTDAANDSGGRWWWGGGDKPNAATAGGGDAMDEGDDDDDEDNMELLGGCVPSGAYVTVTIEGVPASSYEAVSHSPALLTAVSLLPHENKASVVHMGVSQTPGCEQPDDAPVKSKDVLTFRCGWRTWKSRPVFSQNNLNSDKHKFERYLPTGGAFFAATVFGPVTYSPCPVLVFREPNSGTTPSPSPSGGGGERRRQLVAVGSVLGADADRIVVKRIILTGYPVRVHKRHATVKYMFYNPDDVKWFKPAGLVTKHGLQGNIEESVGEHGTMKCLFNAPIKQHDTVCLPLYKRVFPKYEPTDVPTDVGVTVRKDLVVL